MMITMTDTRMGNFNQIIKFLKGTETIEFQAQSRSEKYAWISSVLKRFAYPGLSKKKKGLLRGYIRKITGYSSSQLTRLIKEWQEEGDLKVKHYQRHTFTNKYTDEDIKLLARVDNLHSRLNGNSVKRILEREVEIFENKEYDNLCEISVAQIYRLRKKEEYKKSSCTYSRTTPSSHGQGIGKRQAPEPKGKPGYIRVDTVHQGDKDKEKGVYHINTVDMVLQWEVVGATEKISERYLVPVILSLIKQYPFKIKGFHADNGSEYINQVVAKLLKKLLIEFTKNRPRKSNDNALVESKNGSVIRKHMGYQFISQSAAIKIHEFYQDYFNSYLNFHRPCGFATEKADKKGKISKVYDTYLTPYEKFLTLKNPQQYLKENFTMKQLQKQALAHSDTEFAKIMTKAKLTLFKEIGFAF